jgi:hypothetical protein
VFARCTITVGWAAFLAALAVTPRACLAQDPTLDTQAHKLAPLAPPAPNFNALYCYQNAFGHWDLEENGAAHYRWSDGKTYNDKLTFVGRTSLDGETGFLYRANPQDGTGVGFFFFSDQPFNLGDGPRYKMYYSTDNNLFYRIVLPRGTSRIRLKT